MLLAISKYYEWSHELPPRRPGTVLVLGFVTLLGAYAQGADCERRVADDVSATSYANPVLDEDFPDPAVLPMPDGVYYAYATQTVRHGRRVNIQVAASRDLVRWTPPSDAMPEKPAWASQTWNFWAPHVVAAAGRYIMYFSAQPDRTKTSALGLGMCVGVASADKPQGPFLASPEPLVCGDGFEHIDPMAFDDPRTGRQYLYWGSGFAPIRVQELAPEGARFMPGSAPIDLISPTRDAESYGRLVEGAWVVFRDGYYYLFYSGDDCCSEGGDAAHYAVMVARGSSPTGPFITLAKATGRADSVILQAGKRWRAPGHNAVVRDAAGADWLVYHAVDARRPDLDSSIDSLRPDHQSVRRVMLLHRLRYQNGWPVLDADSPSETTRGSPCLRAPKPAN